MRNTIDFNNLTRRQIAEICGKTERTITNWLKDGCPRGSNGKFNAPEVINWLLLRESDMAGDAAVESEALERYRLARAKLAELDLEDRHGKFVEREMMETALAARAMFLKSDLQNFIYGHVQDMVVKCNGDQQFCPDLIQYWLTNLEAWLGRYTQPIEFEVPK